MTPTNNLPVFLFFMVYYLVSRPPERTVLVSAFSILPTKTKRVPIRRISLPWLHASSRNNNNNKKAHAVILPVPDNEFSRTIQPERVLRSKSRDYKIEIQANPQECDALAQRFDLSHIESLHASLKLRPEQSGTARSARMQGVEVEGIVTATVEQMCVRTSERFTVHVEFPLYSIVRPVTSMATLMMLQREEGTNNDKSNNERQTLESSKASSSSSPTRNYNNNKSTYRPQQDRQFDEMDVMELQQLLQSDVYDEDDVLMEDEAIYASDRGILDLGELVSQLFWLQLDPYPKLPGSGPVQKSITG